MITIPQKTESIVPIDISEAFNDGDSAVFVLKNGKDIILNKEIIQNGEEFVIHLYVSDTADIPIGYYGYAIVITKSDGTSLNFDGKAYIKESGSSGAFVRGGDVIGSSTGGRTDSEFIHSDTTANWNSQPSLIGKLGHIYIYTDYTTADKDGAEVLVPNIKIGDGKAYLIDNPFISLPLESLMKRHADDTAKHITSDERDCWNGKVRCYINEKDSENIVFTTE